MGKTGKYIKEYKDQLKKGDIQKAYRAIMDFMSALKIYLGSQNLEFFAGSIYFGYMDMTYFAFTPPELKARQLKVALVYLHEAGRFDVWLAAGNKRIKDEYIRCLEGRDIGKHRLSLAKPGIDSIIESTLITDPDFDEPKVLMEQIEIKVMSFIEDIHKVL